MPWILPADAREELRNLLSDGDKDKHRWRKKCFGQVNGVNTRFKTFEPRRVTNLTAPGPTLGAFVDDTLVAVSTDFTETGEFVLAVAPVDGTAVTASYYYQWFFDDELDIFLKEATEWLGLGEEVIHVPNGLQPAAKYFAAQEAYMKLTVRWAERWSDMYRLEDAPTRDNISPIEQWLKLAQECRDKAKELRLGFYERNDQSAAPLFGVIEGCVPEVQPKR